MKRALVVGLARSGRAAALLLAREGWQVVAVDAVNVDGTDLVAAGVEVRVPWHAPITDVELVVKSPGVPGESPPVAAARVAGIPIISEIELAAQRLPNPLIAVTGTNGKTTTTELTAHLLRTAGVPAEACGNQGTPLADRVGNVDPATWMVVECSSFQLEDITTFHPRAAVLLNITPDHLDRHGSMDAYLAAKLRIFENQVPGDLAIVPRDLAGRVPHSHVVDEGPAGEGTIAWSTDGLYHRDLGRVTTWDRVTLRGRHNRQNAMAAVALAAHAGALQEALAEGLSTFPGVSHRLEVVATSGGVTYVNDSKATNPDATLAALDAYPRGVHLILGGRAKGTSFTPVAAACGGVVRAYLIGEAADEIAVSLDAAAVTYERCETLNAAVVSAAGNAATGETILLAPACTSFDQYRDFEERGDHFRALAATVTRR